MLFRYRKLPSMIMVILIMQMQLDFVFPFICKLPSRLGGRVFAKDVTELINQTQIDSLTTFIPGDAIEIKTFPDTSSFLNKVFPIDDLGLVEFPIIGKVKVTEMNISELQEYLKNQFKVYLRYPNLIVKPVIRVSILGGVIKPGLYYVDPHSSLWEVVRIAGGFRLEEGVRELQWERSRDEVVDDLTPFFESGASLRQMGFKSGDQLWTPSVSTKSFVQTLTTEVLPILSFATTMFFLYWNFQVQNRLIQSGRSSIR